MHRTRGRPGLARGRPQQGRGEEPELPASGWSARTLRPRSCDPRGSPAALASGRWGSSGPSPCGLCEPSVCWRPALPAAPTPAGTFTSERRAVSSSPGKMEGSPRWPRRPQGRLLLRREGDSDPGLCPHALPAHECVSPALDPTLARPARRPLSLSTAPSVRTR